MVVRLMSAATLLAAASAAQGFFELGTVDMSLNGTPLVIPQFYQSPAQAGEDTPFLPRIFQNSATSFVTIGGPRDVPTPVGAGNTFARVPELAIPGTAALFVDNATNANVTVNGQTARLQEFWGVSSGLEPSAPHPDGSGRQAVWVARIGTTASTAPDLSNTILNIGIREPGSGPVIGRVFADANFGGNENQEPAGGFFNLFYGIELFFAGTADGANFWDLFVVQDIPTPGALALFGIGGLAIARRRRA